MAWVQYSSYGFEGLTTGTVPTSWTINSTYGHSHFRVKNDSVITGTGTICNSLLGPYASSVGELYVPFAKSPGTQFFKADFSINMPTLLVNPTDYPNYNLLALDPPVPTINIGMTGAANLYPSTGPCMGIRKLKNDSNTTIGVYRGVTDEERAAWPDPIPVGQMPDLFVYVPLVNAVAGTTYNCSMMYSSASGKFYVVINGTTYDNSGSAYSVYAPTAIKRFSINSSNITALNLNKFHVDSVVLSHDDSVNNALITTSPGTPNGRAGWFITKPQVLGSDSETPGTTYSISVGDTTSRTRYKAATSTALGAAPISVMSDAELNSVDTVVATVFTAFPGLESLSDATSIKWTSTVPTSSGIKVFDSLGAEATEYMPKDGVIKVQALRGYTSALASGKTHFKVHSVALYINGRLWAESQFSVDGTPPTFTDPFGRPGGVTTVKTANGESGETDSDHIFYDLSVRFSLGEDDMPTRVTSVYAVVTSEAGSTFRTNVLNLSAEGRLPIVDRLGVKPLSSTILGSATHPSGVSSVQWTAERRVPMLTVKGLSGSPNADTGLPPFTYAGITSGSSCPVAEGSTSMLFSGTGYATYDNRGINVNEGTLDVWLRPAAGLNTSNTYTVFFFGRDTDAMNVSTMKLSLAYSSGWKYTFSIVDAFGTPHNVTSSSVTLNTWNHLRLTWKLNIPSGSYQEMYVGGVLQSGSNSGSTTCSFALPHKHSVRADSILDTPASSIEYTPIIIGAGHDFTQNFSGQVSGLRISDVIRFDSPWSWTTLGGWTSTGVSLDTTTGMFSIDTGLLSENELRLVKIRVADTSGVTHNNFFFNTPSAPSVLLRGSYAGENIDGEVVNRWRLVDQQGVFSDLKVTVNPNSLDYSDDGDRLSKSVSINSKRFIFTGVPAPREFKMDWPNIKEDFTRSLVERGESGNTFYLVDHNGEQYVGKFSIDSVSEITATKPSRYKVQASFIGQGGKYDNEMV